jgi:hypothetical protein
LTGKNAIELKWLMVSRSSDLTSLRDARKTLVFHVLITRDGMRIARGRDDADIVTMLSLMFAIEARVARERMRTRCQCDKSAEDAGRRS